MDIEQAVTDYLNGNKEYFYKSVKGNEYTVFSKLDQHEAVSKDLLVKMMLTCFYQQEK